MRPQAYTCIQPLRTRRWYTGINWHVYITYYRVAFGQNYDIFLMYHICCRHVKGGRK